MGQLISPPAPSVGWTTQLDIDFTTLPTQSLAANGTYTIGGFAGWKRENAAQDRVAMEITNGVGLVIKPKVAVYDLVSRTSPLLALPLASLGITDIDWAMKFRFWIQALDAYEVGGFFNPGDNFFWGFDNDSTLWIPYVSMVAPVGTQATRRFSLIGGSSSTSRYNAASDQTVLATVMNIGRLDTGELGMPNKVSSWWDKSSVTWPSLGASSLRPVNLLTTNFPSTFAYQTNVNPNSNISLANNLHLVLGANNGGANDKYFLTVQKIRVDYLTG